MSHFTTIQIRDLEILNDAKCCGYVRGTRIAQRVIQLKAPYEIASLRDYRMNRPVR